MKSGAYLLHNGEYISLFIGSQIPDDFASEVLGQPSFSDYALTVKSGSTPFAPVEGLPASEILGTLVEQLRYEMGGTAGSYAPVRVFLDGDQQGTTELYTDYLIEDTVDKNSEFNYQDFLCLLHKKVKEKKEKM
uniref:Uncharacterized protein n=1 Tax=Strombidium inclinatum TaxID=197538 RepID=A0A7S3IHI3_9SPIT|mmetsp:Transcript_19420/g.29839  ORF Transcript_19420/g.29839 Transcript_19420/m.29839 type:complete len:134 (+) Transcript_19420:2558-2959(+)